MIHFISEAENIIGRVFRKINLINKIIFLIFINKRLIPIIIYLKKKLLFFHIFN